MTQQTAQWWKGSSGRTGQLCSSQEFVPSEEVKSISTLSEISSCEKTTSGRTEKDKTNIKQTFNMRILLNLISINI
jgi:hypothetical protein